MSEEAIFASVCPTHGAIQLWIGDGTLAGNEPTQCFLYVKDGDGSAKRCDEYLKLTLTTGGDLE